LYQGKSFVLFDKTILKWDCKFEWNMRRRWTVSGSLFTWIRRIDEFFVCVHHNYKLNNSLIHLNNLFSLCWTTSDQNISENSNHLTRSGHLKRSMGFRSTTYIFCLLRQAILVSFIRISCTLHSRSIVVRRRWDGTVSYHISSVQHGNFDSSFRIYVYHKCRKIHRFTPNSLFSVYWNEKTEAQWLY
jgi:hypothetical protein